MKEMWLGTLGIAGRRNHATRKMMINTYDERASRPLAEHSLAGKVKLPVRIQAGEGETAPSLLGRAGLANGYRRLQSICSDQSISMLDLTNGQEDEVRRVADLAGVDPEVLIFNTPRLDAPGWFFLGRERIKFSALTRLGGQICPICIAEDRVNDPPFGGHQRGIWQISHIRSCHRHDVILEQNHVNCASKEAHDIFFHLRAWRGAQAVPVGDLARPMEAYLLDRIQHERGDNWADRFEFHAVALFSEALGILLEFGPRVRIFDLSRRELIKAGSVGFRTFRTGPASIVETLKSLQSQAVEDRADYGKLYAPILVCLRERRMDPDFDDLRRLVREFIRDNFYIPAGTSLLGETCDTPRVLTVGIAAKAAGVPISLLNRQLKNVGALSGKRGDNTISDRGALVPRDQVDAALEVVKGLASFAVTRAALGIDRYTMERFCRDGVIPLHFSSNDGCMPLVHEDEIVRFILRLQAFTNVGIEMSDDFIPLSLAASRSHCSVSWLIDQVLSGALRLASRIPAPFRLPDFLIDLEQVKALLMAVPEDVLTAAEAAKLLGITPGTIHALAEGGFLDSTAIECRLANRDRRLVRKGDLEVFANSHIVLRALSGTRKASFEETQQYIADNDVAPLALGKAAHLIFKRMDIERIAHRTGGERLQRLLMVDEAKLQSFFN